MTGIIRHRKRRGWLRMKEAIDLISEQRRNHSPALHTDETPRDVIQFDILFQLQIAAKERAMDGRGRRYRDPDFLIEQFFECFRVKFVAEHQASVNFPRSSRIRGPPA